MESLEESQSALPDPGNRATAWAMSQSVLEAIRAEGFEPLGWFTPEESDRVPGEAATAILIGNAGPDMFERFARERDPARDLMDDWCLGVLGTLARRLGATAHFPFDKPPLPFSLWGRRAKAGHASPLGLNIHPEFGLWQAYRALFAFVRPLGLPEREERPSPCVACTAQPCLHTCPVGAFTPGRYDVERCAGHLATPQGRDCLELGCRARRACPVGVEYAYSPSQARFHMSAFARNHVRPTR